MPVAARPDARDVLNNAITNLDKPLSEANCASLRIVRGIVQTRFGRSHKCAMGTGLTILHRRSKLLLPRRKNADGVRDREQLHHLRPCEAEGLQSRFLLRPDAI